MLIRPAGENAQRQGRVFQRFTGMPELPDPARFLQAGKIVRLGNPPARVEVHNGISAVNYEDAASRSVTGVFDGLTLPFISLADLRANKAAAGRNKDLADLDYLPPA